MSRWCHFTFLSILSVLFARCTLGDRACIAEDRVYWRITNDELNVTDVKVTRRYVVCKDSYIQIKSYDYQAGKFYGDGIPALSIFQPNVEICCGFSCSLDNNCTFAGGTFHVELLSSDFVDTSIRKYELTNILLQGFKFTGAAEASINVYGVWTKEPVGANLTVSDCLFYQNNGISNIWLVNNFKSVLTVQDSTFRNNYLIETALYPDSGLIASEKAANVTVRNTQFLNNFIGISSALSAGLRAYINVYNANATYPDSQYASRIEIYDSNFMFNQGHTYALVVGGLFGDGTLIGGRNTQLNNTAFYPRNNTCDGMSRLIQDPKLYPKYYTYYYYVEDAPCVVKFAQFSTPRPTKKPTARPSRKPSAKPTRKPTRKPSKTPTKKPTRRPTNPTARPSRRPSSRPTKKPTLRPTKKPTARPTSRPTTKPTSRPTSRPTKKPTARPTSRPTIKLTLRPTSRPTKTPTARPTSKPSKTPTATPTKVPTAKPTLAPTKRPTTKPSRYPSHRPTRKPTRIPTRKPTLAKTVGPTRKPSRKPTRTPTRKPSRKPTLAKAVGPTRKPSRKPTRAPTRKPSRKPTLPKVTGPTRKPSGKPTRKPFRTRRPTTKPV